MQIDKRTLLWGFIIVLLIVTLFLAFKSGFGGSTGQLVSSASGAMVGGC